MNQKRPLVVGNWKMELSHKAAVEAAQALLKQLKGMPVTSEVVICPSFTSLPEIAQMAAKSEKVSLGAQNVHWEEKGAWTGEVSVQQIKPFVNWCLVGHSERRALAGETDEQVARKTAILQKHGITPVVCVGESLAERDGGQTVVKLTQQVRTLMADMTLMMLSKLVIAYEPIWAIGTGVTPDPDEVAESMLFIRKVAAERFGSEGLDRLRVLYGGSVTSENARALLSEPGVDGLLVGGASVRPLELAKIIKVAQEAQ